MKLVDATELVSLGRRAVKRLGLIAGAAAHGFRIDLVYALDDEIGLFRFTITKTGDPSAAFV